MPFTVEATYENGVLKPSEPLPLQEAEKVRITIESQRTTVVTELAERLSGLERLKDGWNSYSAPAPTPAAIGNAKTLLTLASAAGIIPERIEPSAMGGVALRFTAASREVEVEFYNAGDPHALFSDRETETLDTASVVPSGEGYKALLQDIRRYLHGHNGATSTP